MTRESRPPPDGWVNPLSRRFIPQTQVRVGRIATTWGAILVTYLAVAAEPLPGPSEDRVGFPTGYATNYVVLRTVERDEGAKLVTVYGNAVAASVTNKAQLPYPNDSVLVMETAGTVRRADGKPDRAASGLPKKDAVLGLHVMRRGPSFGEAYGSNRSGDWEFAEYRADGSYITTPQKSGACAECHVKAGKELDFVYKARLVP